MRAVFEFDLFATPFCPPSSHALWGTPHPLLLSRDLFVEPQFSVYGFFWPFSGEILLFLPEFPFRRDWQADPRIH